MISDKDIKKTIDCIEKVNESEHKKIYQSFLKQKENSQEQKMIKFHPKFAISLIVLVLGAIILIIALNSNDRSIEDEGIILGSIVESDNSSGEPKPMNYPAYNSFKCKIEIKKSIYNSNETIYIRMYLGCLYDKMYVDDKITLSVITSDYDYVSSDILYDFTPSNYPVTIKGKKIEYEKYIDFEFTKKEKNIDEFLDIKFSFDGTCLFGEEELKWIEESQKEMMLSFHVEYSLKAYVVDDIMVLSSTGYPTKKANYYLYQKGIIDGNELSKRHYQLHYRDYSVLAISGYHKQLNYTDVAYESENLLIRIRIYGDHEVIDEIWSIQTTILNYMKEHGSYKNEYFIDIYRTAANNFMKYCFDNNYITQSEYENELKTIVDTPEMSFSFIAEDRASFEEYYKVVDKYKNVITNY